MDILAYCCASFADSTQKAAGVVPLLSPPLSAFGGPGLDRFPVYALEGQDVLYFKLHGLPGQPYWYGDDMITALTADQLPAADLSRTVVFVANCHLWASEKSGKGAPMLDALLDAGAMAVVGGGGENFGKMHEVYGADLLGKWFVMCLRLGASPLTAFYVAKARVSMEDDRGARDALDFEIFTQESRGSGIRD
jgi:hypothetical protein